MAILSTQEITGDGTEQSIDLPSVPSSNAVFGFLFDDFTEDLTLRQGEGGPEIRVPADGEQPFPIGRFRLASAPDRIIVANEDSVTITIVRLY